MFVSEQFGSEFHDSGCSGRRGGGERIRFSSVIYDDHDEYECLHFTLSTTNSEVEAESATSPWRREATPPPIRRHSRHRTALQPLFAARSEGVSLKRKGAPKHLCHQVRPQPAPPDLQDIADCNRCRREVLFTRCPAHRQWPGLSVAAMNSL